MAVYEASERHAPVYFISMKMVSLAYVGRSMVFERRTLKSLHDLLRKLLTGLRESDRSLLGLPTDNLIQLPKGT